MASFRRRNDARRGFIGTLLVRTKLILVVSSFVRGVDQFLKVPSHPRLHMDRDKGQRGRSSRMLFSIISYLSEREIPSLHLDVSADLSISNSLGNYPEDGKYTNNQVESRSALLRSATPGS
jgi:hypothetical protein